MIFYCISSKEQNTQTHAARTPQQNKISMLQDVCEAYYRSLELASSTLTTHLEDYFEYFSDVSDKIEKELIENNVEYSLDLDTKDLFVRLKESLSEEDKKNISRMLFIERNLKNPILKRIDILANEDYTRRGGILREIVKIYHLSLQLLASGKIETERYIKEFKDQKERLNDELAASNIKKNAPCYVPHQYLIDQIFRISGRV
jgi:hypothetical protein